VALINQLLEIGLSSLKLFRTFSWERLQQRSNKRGQARVVVEQPRLQSAPFLIQIAPPVVRSDEDDGAIWSVDVAQPPRVLKQEFAKQLPELLDALAYRLRHGLHAPRLRVRVDESLEGPYAGDATTTGSTLRKYIHQVMSKSSILERSGSTA
jgi:hypothetical protein